MEHIGHFPSSFCGVSLNSMSQSIHTGSSSQTFWHGGHHVRVNDSNNRHIMWVNTDKFSLSFHIGDNVVDGYFSCGTCCGRNSDNWNTWFFGWSNTFQASDILKFRICNDDADCFCCVHRRTAANRYDIISAGSFECSNTVLYIFNSWICFDVRIDLVCKALAVQNISYFFGNAEFNQVRVRADESFLKCSCFYFCCNFFHCACSMIGSFVEHDSVCHDDQSPF